MSVKFAHRVVVETSSGLPLFHVHGELAARMLAAGEVGLLDDRRKVYRVVIKHSPSHLPKPVLQVNPYLYTMQRFVRKTQIRRLDGRVVPLFEFKAFPDSDTWSVNVPMTECIVPVSTSR